MENNILILSILASAGIEIILVVAVLGLLMVGAFSNNRIAPMISGISIAVLVACSTLLLWSIPDGILFAGSFIMDPFARFMKLLVLLGSVAAITLSVGYAREERFERFEYPILVLTATLGMLMMISANDILALYLSIELQSLALYVVATINRDNSRSTEAGLKYFILGALSSGMLLYGFSLIYGFSGQIGFAEIAASISDDNRNLGLIFGLVFVITGIAFKISAVPFHMWTPDVYEGAPTPVTAFFAVAPKLAAMAVLIRIAYSAFLPMKVDWQQIIVFIAIASMILGAFAAIGQKNIKRLMAYSSISHMGYALVGLAAGSQTGLHGLMIYLIIYLVTTLGVFACILAMRNRDGLVEDIEELAGLSRTRPMMAFGLLLLLFSLAGIPPMAGFFGKFYVFSAAIEAELYALAIVGVLTSVISLFYYLRIVAIMFIHESVNSFISMPTELKLILGGSSAFVIAFIMMDSAIANAVLGIAQTFF